MALSGAVCIATALLSACGQENNTSATIIPSTTVKILLERTDTTEAYDALKVLSTFETGTVMQNALAPTGLTDFTFPKDFYAKTQGIIGVGPLEDTCVILISLPAGTTLTTWDATRATVTIIPRFDPRNTTGVRASNIRFDDQVRQFADAQRRGCQKIA